MEKNNPKACRVAILNKVVKEISLIRCHFHKDPKEASE